MSRPLRSGSPAGALSAANHDSGRWGAWLARASRRMQGKSGALNEATGPFTWSGGEVRSVAIRRVLFSGLLFAMALCGAPLFAAELSVDRRTIQLDESITITVTLDDRFASLDEVTVPVQNLVIVGAPSVSSEFSWFNGSTMRRKVLRYVARPKGAGAALAGPLTLTDAEGKTETLPPVSLQVLPDAAAGSSDPLTILRELLATQRDPLFVIGEVDRQRVVAGEEVVVTWTIYNAASVQQLQIGKLPGLEEFWSEELDVRNERTTQMFLGDQVVQKVIIRRAALFPLKAGELKIDPLEVEALVMRRTDPGGFSIFEGSTAVVTRRSSQLKVEVLPLPPGPAVDVVGDVSLRCGAPVQRNGGPVVFDVIMSGRANLRGAPAPRFDGASIGSVQIEERGVVVDRQRDSASMTRRWKYIIFPSEAGRMTLPPVVTNVYVPASGRRQLRCDAQTLEVSPADVLSPASTSASPPTRRTGAAVLRPMLPWLAGFAIAVVLSLIAIPRMRRLRRLRAAVATVVGEGAPGQVREAVEAMLVARQRTPRLLQDEHSAAGDAYRALRSLLDAAERQRLEVGRAEIEDRVRDLVQSLQ